MSDLQINSLYVTRHNSSTPIMLYQADWRPIVVDIHTQLVNAQAGKAYTITLDVFDFENGRSIYKASHSFSLMEDELLESTADATIVLKLEDVDIKGVNQLLLQVTIEGEKQSTKLYLDKLKQAVTS